MELSNFEEQVFFSTVRITIPNRTGRGGSIGTGFLFRVPIEAAENRNALLLISNKHVFGDTSREILLNFHKHDATDIPKPSLGDMHVIRGKDFSNIYIEHPDPGIDLACLNVSGVANQGVFLKHINLEMLASFDEQDLLPGKEVWFIGYPENRFDTAHNLPILRRGYIASMPRVNFNGLNQLVIDAQVFQGSSGSPVFSTLGNRFRLVGVVTETMIRHQELQAIPTGTSSGVQQVLGLGIVLKSNLVKELADAAAAEIKNRQA